METISRFRLISRVSIKGIDDVRQSPIKALRQHITPIICWNLTAILLQVVEVLRIVNELIDLSRVFIAIFLREKVQIVHHRVLLTCRLVDEGILLWINTGPTSLIRSTTFIVVLNQIRIRFICIERLWIFSILSQSICSKVA